jgi:hypothetical protein
VTTPLFLDLARCARAALAEPEAVGPSASDVTELFYRHMGEGSEVGFENAIAEILARYGAQLTEQARIARSDSISIQPS